MSEMSRRQLIKAAVGISMTSAALSRAGRLAPDSGTQTRYIAAYDTESAACARTLLANPKEYRKLLDYPLFEIASHTYDHEMLRDNDFCGSAAPARQKRKEVVESKKIIEDISERPCIGLRPGCGFDNALREATDVLALVREAGYKYVSSLAWGPDYSMPALLRQPFTYSPDGFPELWELPGHGWHENLLKDNNNWGPKRLTLWPSPMPEAIPKGFVKTPEDEFAVNRVFLEKAIERDKTFVSLIWHPWSLHAFDGDMKMLELTFSHAHKLGLLPCTYADLYRHVSQPRLQTPGKTNPIKPNFSLACLAQTP
jgi:peptidoglycan/xylan/chitin deacetylase (PgdA/CDA1 family)